MLFFWLSKNPRLSILLHLWLQSFLYYLGVSARKDGNALTPPMGWLSWTRFMCTIDCETFPKGCINENLFVEMADLMVSEGYLAAGYDRVNIDDCWMSKRRDPLTGRLVADPKRFPRGIKWLSDYVHSKGLKLGIYANIGELTCERYPGSQDSLLIDAKTFAEWGIDMLKLDGCFAKFTLMDQGYPLMGRYLNETGRQIVYSCSWPFYIYRDARRWPDYKSIQEHCHMWRNADDIQIMANSVAKIIEFYDRHQDIFASYHGPGSWNDPDMIIIGNPGLTLDQARIQMAIWCIWSAPLLMSNDLRDVPGPFKEILLNRRLIAVNQDPLGIMGKLIRRKGAVNIYVKPMTPVVQENIKDHLITKYSFAFAFYNRHEQLFAWFDISLKELGFVHNDGYEVQELFSGDEIGHMSLLDRLNVTVRPSSAVIYKATIKQKIRVAPLAIPDFDEDLKKPEEHVIRDEGHVTASRVGDKTDEAQKEIEYLYKLEQLWPYLATLCVIAVIVHRLYRKRYCSSIFTRPPTKRMLA